MIFDVDGTLMPHHDHELPLSVQSYLHMLGEVGISLAIASNAYGARPAELNQIFGIKRLDKLVDDVITPDQLGNPQSHRKPRPDMLNHLMRRFEVDGQSTIVVGDQMFSDIKAANRARGVDGQRPHSVLLPRRGKADDPWVRGVRRPIEELLRIYNGYPGRDASFPEQVTSTETYHTVQANPDDIDLRNLGRFIQSFRSK
jgi:HAD superfamily hydrolase (TIGR01662 family)